MKLLFCMLLTSLIISTLYGQNYPADFVNPLIGTDTEFQLSNGNTYPEVSLPHGMNAWSAQTAGNSDLSFPSGKNTPPWWNDRMKNGWFYSYREHRIKGIKQTHQPSAWLTDYGAFSLFAETGPLKFDENDRASWFSHKTEISKPYYYNVFLADYKVNVEISPTERGACFRFTLPKCEQAYLLLDAFDMGSQINVFAEKRCITGYCQNNSGGVPKNFRNYFVLYFDKDFEKTIVWQDSLVLENATEVKGNHVMAAIKFRSREGKIINARVASSFISIEQAELNLQREIGTDSFDQVKAKALNIWNETLNKINIEGGTEQQNITFYTAFYRAMLFPRMFYEFDKNNEVIHYSPFNGKTLPGYLFTDVGFWDTFRGLFPFLTLIEPDLVSRIMAGLENTYKESDWLPEWVSPGHRDCMIGSNSASVVTDAYLKGVRGYNIDKLYEGILKNTRNEAPLMSMGRAGVNYYNTLGYVPYDVNIKENTARTLEYSYDDFCIMKLSQALNRPNSETDIFRKRANNYKNVFDPSTKFMRGRNADGTFQTPFNPCKWGDAFTEGNSWHYTWSVLHDPAGLIKLLGGSSQFAGKLDSLFTVTSPSDYSYYGFKIHEITEMEIYNMGQYAHGNEPMHHVLYLYNWAGQPWKTQYWARLIMNRLYTPNPDGLCGDEDNGQTSVWYVLSAMGFYPVCPVTGQWVLGSPLFKKISIRQANDKYFIINAPENNIENIYIKSAELNGRNYTKSFLNNEDLVKGGVLKLEMSNLPNKSRGANSSDLPYSLTDQ